MDHRREGVHRHLVDEEVDLHEGGRLVAVGLVVEAGVALGAALQLIEEVDHDLAQGDPVEQLDTLGRDVLHAVELAAPRLAEIHDRADVLGRHDEGGPEHGLVDVVELAGLGHLARVVEAGLGTVGAVGHVGHRRARWR